VYNETYVIYQCNRANLGRPCIDVHLLIMEEDVPCTGFGRVYVRFIGFDLEFTPEQITTLTVKAAALEAAHNARWNFKENLAPADEASTSETPRRRRKPQAWREPANMDPDARRALLSDKRITEQHLIDYFGRS
jgi:hypothetical protein